MLSAILILALAGAAPLVDAVKSGDRAAAMTLIAQRADVNAPEVDGTTPLHWAVHHGDLELAQRLIRAGAKVNVETDYGSTPMSEASPSKNSLRLFSWMKRTAAGQRCRIFSCSCR